MIEKQRKTLDKSGETEAVLTDLSKAFDCIDRNLLIAKLDAYGFEKQSTDFLDLYLTKRKQKKKVHSGYSSQELLLSGVPQSSILGPLPFNIYVSAMFFETPKMLIFRWVCRQQYSLHMFFKYRRSVRKPSRGIRETLSVVSWKSFCSKCRKVSRSSQFQNNKQYRYFKYYRSKRTKS